MSKGAIYSIITRTLQDDKFLDAMALLKDTLIRRMMQNGANLQGLVGQRDDKKFDFTSDNYGFLKDFARAIPSISLLDHTAAIFLNYSFKPYALVAQQYSLKTNPGVRWGNSVRVTLDKDGQFISDTVVHVRIEGLRALDPRDRVKYIDMPGARLFDLVTFEIERRKVDFYTGETYNQHYRSSVSADKREAWERMMGQQQAYPARFVQDPAYDFYSEQVTLSDGAQTFKQNQDALDLWIPLLFWFKDYKSALPMLQLNWGQTDFVFNVTAAENLIAFADFGGGGAFATPAITAFDVYTNNLYTDPLLYELFMMKIRIFLIRTHRQITELLTDASSSIRLFGRIRWPVERLEISFRPTANLSLSQHWYSTAVLSRRDVYLPAMARLPSSFIVGSFSGVPSSNSAALVGPLSSVSGFYIGYSFNITSGAGYNVSDVARNRYFVRAYNGATATITVDRDWDALFDVTTQFELYVPQPQIGQLSFYSETSPVRRLKMLLRNSVELFDYTPSEYFEAYTPFRTKGLNGSYSPGFVSIPFQMAADTTDPKGHYVFADGETYLYYESDYISADSPVTAHVTAISLNFFYLDGRGGAKLWYP